MPKRPVKPHEPPQVVPLRWAIHEAAHRLIWVWRGRSKAHASLAQLQRHILGGGRYILVRQAETAVHDGSGSWQGRPLIAAEVDDLVDGGPLFPRLGREDFLRDLPAAIDLQQRKLIGEEPRWNRAFELHVGHCRTDKVD